MAENQKTNIATVRFSSGVGNTLQIKFPKVVQKEKCSCSISQPAKSFKELVELVKQAENILIKNGYNNIEDRISIIRGIYYGTEWSLDYNVEKSKARNGAFNYAYVQSTVIADARKALKCCSDCKANLFNSLYESFEVSDSKYKAVDFGHLIIGLDARRKSNSIKTKIPSQGGTGLEICTWVGDLGGGVGKLSLDRIKNPKKRAKTLFSPFGHSYGCMVNLEGDIAAYLVGMKSSNSSLIDNCANNFKTIYEAIEDYFDNIWDKRGFYFLKMLGGNFNNNKLTNKSTIEEYFAKSFEKFAAWYLGLRMKEKKLGGVEDFSLAYGYFKPTSEEVASIFMDGLLHIVENPKDMMTARTDPEPKNKENTTIENVYQKAKEIQDKIEKKGKEIMEKVKEKQNEIKEKGRDIIKKVKNIIK